MCDEKSRVNHEDFEEHECCNVDGCRADMLIKECDSILLCSDQKHPIIVSKNLSQLCKDIHLKGDVCSDLEEKLQERNLQLICAAVVHNSNDGSPATLKYHIIRSEDFTVNKSLDHIIVFDNEAMDVEEFSSKITEHQSENMLNVSNNNLAGDKVTSIAHICNQAEEDEEDYTDGSVTVPRLEKEFGHRSAEMLKLSLPFDDSEVVKDNKTGGIVKQSEKLLYLNPNLVTHVNLDDPAKGRKLNYEDLDDRIKAFKLPPQWEGPVDYQLMAEAGFVYTGQEDLVYCFSCNVKLDRWSKDMEPLLRHKEESPTCSFMREKLQAVKKGKTKSVVAPSKPLNSRLTSSIGELQSSSLITSKAIHAVVTGLNEPRLSYGGSVDDRPGAFLPITPENYQSEAERIKSFIGWPLNETVHPEQLARVGFVYTGDGALVQCFQCGVKYRHWYKGDVPLNVHQKCNPRCPFLQTLTSKSKSLPPEHQPMRSYIQPESIGTNTEEVSKHSLQFPEYSKETIRLQSFKHWGGVIPAKELAEGGFYMIARRDVVRCFSCNVVVQDWERSDNVIDEHRRHSPNCVFLKNFLSSKLSSEILSPLSSVDVTGQSCKEKSVIKSKGNQSLQASQLPHAMDPSSSAIKLPPSMKSRGSSSSPVDTQEEAIPGIRYPPSWGQHRSTSPQGVSKEILEDSDESFHSAKSHGADYSILTSLDPPKTKIMYEESLSEGMENNISIKMNDSKGDDAGSPALGLCQICYDKKIDCIFLPCGHARTCEGCATRIKNSGQPCPYCRKGVSTTYRIYL